MRALRAARSRLIAKLSTVPRFRDWAEAVALAALAGGVVGLLGFSAGFLTWSPSGDWTGIARTGAIALILPALGEELLFRGALLPSTGSSRTQWTWAAASLGAFVAWHPLAAALWLPAAQPLFFSPSFLLAAATLGAACTLSVARSGSIWPAVAMHWTAVVAWKAVFGGPALIG